jgi:hypothetical protein
MINFEPGRPFRPSSIARRRLGRIVVAYLAACFAAAVVLPFGFILDDVLSGRGLTMRASDWLVLPAGLFVVSVIAAAPFATLVIVLAESLRLVALAPYVAAGGLVGLGVEFVSRRLYTGRAIASPEDASIYLLVVLVGALAGFVYWLTAIRNRPIVGRM